MSNYDILVIGAGCGGLTAAACAAKEGKKVLLLERHNSPGGFATSFVRGRFEFEASLHELCSFSTESDSGDVTKIFKDLGIADGITWTSVPYAYRLITTGSDGKPLDVTMPFGEENFIKAMEKYVPTSKRPMQRLMALAKNICEGTDFISSLDGELNFKTKKEIYKKYGNFIRTAPYGVDEVLTKIGLSRKAQDILDAYWLYLGVPTPRLNFIHYISMLYSYITLGACIPKNRSHEISMALAGCIEDNGGEIRYNSHVSRIVFNKGKACAVILKDGEKIECDHIICNCSPTTAYTKMIKSKDVPKSAVKRTNARTFGARGVCVYLGLNRSPEELGIKDYNTFITDTADSEKQFSLMKTLKTNNSEAVVCMNIADPDCSPKGTTILTITSLYTDNCWANVEPEEYFDEKDYIAAKLISVYEKTTGIVIHNNIEEMEVATPLTFAHYTNTPQGVIYGYLGDDWDGIISRITSEKSECDTKGLRFCGGWGVQLSGVSSSIASGRNCAYATIDDINNETKAEVK